MSLPAVQPTASQTDWTAPQATTLLKIAGSIDTSATNQPAFLSNLDCTHYTFRFSRETTMQDGCFLSTAFGALGVDNKAAIMNGTDEAVRIEPAGNSMLVPMPHSAVVASLSPGPLSGSYLNFYTYITGALTDIYDYTHTKILYKQVTGSTNLHFTDRSGNQLPVNPESLAFSSNGAWMIVESPWHSFMRVNLATFDIVPFAPSFTSWSYDTQLYDSQVAVSDDGRYVAIQNQHYNSFQVYDLSQCTGAATNDMKPLDCARHDYQSYVSSTISGYHKISKLRFLNDTTISLNVMYDLPNSQMAPTDTYELSPNNHITWLTNYIGLGDSYASGEGAFNYTGGTDLPYNKCHLSANSYPLLLAQSFFHGDGHSVACSGALMHDINDTSGGYTGQVSGGTARKNRAADSIDAILNSYMPGYIAQYEFVKKYQPKNITISISGNDIGFGDIVKNCVTVSIKTSTCYDSYEARKQVSNTISRQLTPLMSLFSFLQSASPNTALYAVGYPQIVFSGGSCGLNVHLDAKEITFAQAVTDELNKVIRQAAEASGVTYVDISQALSGHRLCEAKGYSLAVNGLTAGDDTDVLGAKLFGHESYHPNTFGHALIEQAILTQTKNFSIAKPAADKTKAIPIITAPDAPILQAPVSGKDIHDVTPARITQETAVRGDQITVDIDGLASGYPPNTRVVININGQSTTATTDQNGTVHQTITIPPDTPIGYQPVTVTGPGPTGNPADTTQPVYIGGSPDDSDSDGVPDNQDQCPGVVNSGIDADDDHIDDACDPQITDPPPLGQPTPSSGTDSPAGGNGTPSTNPQTTVTNIPVPVEPQPIPVGPANGISTNQPVNDNQPVRFNDTFLATVNLSAAGGAVRIISKVQNSTRVPLPLTLKSAGILSPGSVVHEPQAAYRQLTTLGTLLKHHQYNILRCWWWAVFIFVFWWTIGTYKYYWRGKR